MKLSEVRGERVFDVVADLVDPVVAIALDKDVAVMFDMRGKPDDMSAWEFLLTKLRESLPALIKTHRDDLVAIVSTVQGVTPEEYVEGLSVGSLIRDILDLVTDRDFTAFF